MAQSINATGNQPQQLSLDVDFARDVPYRQLAGIK
jgi:hypothetical protein